ncbi:shikimate kinase [Bradyrhizobium sp. STM 3561]|uniref:shikimate kinase n=1 Tax=unclassified Bradyrhizobium TaxID=2631580 RepID=UPI00388D9801
MGRALAKQLGLTFVDSDKEIEAKAGKSITMIFAEDGEAHFRDLEANEISPLLDRGPLVLATGVRDQNGNDTASFCCFCH